VFAPNQAALAADPNWSAVASDPDAVAAFVRANTVNGAYTLAELCAATPPVNNLDGDPLEILPAPGDPTTCTINGVTVVASQQGTNGYVHTVSAPVVAPTPTTEPPAGTDAPPTS
jgi:hypothetical protein